MVEIFVIIKDSVHSVNTVEEKTYVSIRYKDHIVKYVKVATFANIINVRRDVKSVVVLNYVSHHGVIYK